MNWIYPVVAALAWIPAGRAWSRIDYADCDPDDRYFAAFMSALMGAIGAMVWPLLALGLLAYSGRRFVAWVFVGKPRVSRSTLERRIEALEREVEL